LNNVGEFRAVRDISIKPIHSKDAIKETMTLEQLMDLAEGPIPKGKAVKYFLNTPSTVLSATTTKNRSSKLSTVLKII